MPFSAPSIYQPGTVDLVQLLLQQKNGTPRIRDALQQTDQNNNSGAGVSASSASDASGNGTPQSAAVGNAIGNAVGNMTMSAVIGPVAMAAASLTGVAPQSALSQVMSIVAQALGISVNPDGTTDTDPTATATSAVAEAMNADTDAADTASASDGTGVAGSAADGNAGGPGDTGSTDGDSADSGATSGDSADSGYVKGGLIKGVRKAEPDTEHIRATPGEYMLPEHVVQALGTPFLDRLVSSIPNVLGGNQGG